MTIDAAYCLLQSFILGSRHSDLVKVMRTLVNASPVDIIFPLLAYTTSARGISDSPASRVQNCSTPAIKALRQSFLIKKVWKYIDIFPATFLGNNGFVVDIEDHFYDISRFILSTQCDIPFSPIRAEMITFELMSHHGIRTLSKLKELARSNRLFEILSQSPVKTCVAELIVIEDQVQSLIAKAISS